MEINRHILFALIGRQNQGESAEIQINSLLFEIVSMTTNTTRNRYDSLCIYITCINKILLDKKNVSAGAMSTFIVFI